MIILSRILKIILFIIFFAIFFEAGLISAYTIVTSQPPDVNKLITMQVDELSSLFNFGSGSIGSNQNTLNVTNPNEVATAINATGIVDGVNIQSITATTSQSTKNVDTLLVNITATGYKDVITGDNTSAQVVISPNQTYTILATATGNLSTGKTQITIDVSTLKIISTKELYSKTS
ncbi:hypothetical protein [Methanobacterium paludis]|uniref:hypothetical protein n=1 Tax=Methanobacterium paludis (strain DSM 25820 / JCM 18151 / SWAN1) TaxID=868131 RepID=UPI00373AED42